MSNSSSTCPNLKQPPLFIVLAILSCISGVICVIGNATVVVTIYKTKRFHKVSYSLVASLAIADGLVGALLNPLLAAKLIYRYSNYTLYVPDALGLPDDFFWIQGLLVSTFSLTAISIDRYVAIMKNIYYCTLMTTRRCWMIIAFAWIVPTLTAFVRVFIHKDDFKWLWLTTMVMAVAFPLSITTYCYYKILTSAREQARKLVEFENVRNTKAAKTMLIVLSVFAVTYTPSIIMACFNAFEKMSHCQFLRRYAVGWNVASLIAYSSSAMNPWIYAMRSIAFRSATRTALGFKRRTQRNSRAEV